jgi:VCBS repeat-containing protein
MLFIIGIIISNPINAQEAKIVEYGRWGSGTYVSHIELNGYNYIFTEANKIDVIDPSIQGKESLITSIDMAIEAEYENYQYMFSSKLSKFGNNLVFQGSDRVKIFQVDDNHKLSLLYSMSIEPYENFKPLFQNDKLYIFDETNHVHVVTEDGNGFNVTTKELGIELPGSYTPKIFSDDKFYFIILRELNDGVWTTNIHQYDIETQELITTLNYESAKSATFSYIGSELFIIEKNKKWILASVKNKKIQQFNDFGDVDFHNRFFFHTDAGKLFAISSYSSDSSMDHYVYSISDNHDVTIISQQSLVPMFPDTSGLGRLKELSFNDGKWVGLSENYGLFEASLTDDLVTELKPYFNRSGSMGKVAIINDKAFAPRRNRVDVLDISTATFQLEGSSYVRANDVLNHDEQLLTSSWYDVSSYSVNIDNVLQLQSTSSNSAYYTQLKTSSYLFVVNSTNDGWILSRYNINNLNEAPLKISVPDSDNFCSNQLGLAEIKNQLAIVEDCSKSVILFSNYNTDDIEYYKTLDNNYSDSRFEAKDEFFYFTGGHSFNVIKLNDLDELEKVSSIDFPENSDSDTFWFPSFSLVGEHLLASYGQQIYMYDLSTSSTPKFISNTKAKYYLPLNTGEFQSTGNYISYSNDVEGLFSLFKINYAPQILTAQIEINEDTPKSLIEIVEDPEGDDISFEVITAPEHGELSEDTGLYTPAENFFGEDSFIVKIVDVHGNFIEQEITVSILSVNDAPNINTTELFSQEDIELVELLDITDVEGDQLSYSIDEQPNNGAASLNDQGELTYKSDSNYFGNDSVKVLVTDIHGASTSNIISISVESVNDLPVLIASSFEGEEDSIVEGELSASDVEDNELNFSVVTDSGVNGQASVQTNGQFVFTPNENFFGQALFIAQVTDAEQGVSQQTIIVIIEGSDDAPVAESLITSVSHNGSTSNSLVSKDIDGDSLSYTLITDVNNGALSLSTIGEYTYTATAGYVGTDSFTYEVSDGKTNVQGTVTFTVQAAPVIQDKEESSGGSMSYILMMLTLTLHRCLRLKSLTLS